MLQPSSSFYIMLRNYNPITEITSPQLRQIFSSYDSTTLSTFKDHWNALHSNDPVKNLGYFFAKLDSTLSQISDPGIVQGWRSEYNKQPDSVKSQFLTLKPKPTFLGKSFARGGIVDQRNIASGPVIPFLNLQEDSQLPINYVNTSIELPTSLQSNLAALSTILGKLVNKNISSIQSTTSTSDKAHGSNLVPDSKFVERMGQVVAPFMEKVFAAAGDAGSFLLKTINFNPFGIQNADISAPNLAFQQSVEGQSLAVNAIGQDIKQSTKVSIRDFASPKQTNLV
jgi:hypothetical protein